MLDELDRENVTVCIHTWKKYVEKYLKKLKDLLLFMS